MLANIAVIDKTGRGHSICDSLITNNPDVTVYYIPGTSGIFDKRIRVVPWINIEDPGGIADFCSAANVDLVVVSHIDALKNGVADTLRESGLSVLGPSAAVMSFKIKFSDTALEDYNYWKQNNDVKVLKKIKGN